MAKKTKRTNAQNETSAPNNTDRAREVEAAYLVSPGIFLIGSLERGLTVYNQQVRAHNLIWALWELQRAGGRPVGRVAVVGGGVAGLTAVAALLCLFDEKVTVSFFEERSDLCPLQQGSDHRWLHPRIYDWPTEGSRTPSASLPVLNWSEGRASDVARTVTHEFSAYCETFAKPADRLSIYLGLRQFRIDASSREITWVGNKATRAGAFFHFGRPEGGATKFDTVIVAAGFGLETQSPDYPTASYWRNEQLAQPVLDGNQRRYLISGFGDGALIDLCRLTIERFRQDTIIYELFKKSLLEVEEHFSRKLETAGSDSNIFKMLDDSEPKILRPAREELCKRIRKDVIVTLHLSGRNDEVKSFPQIFGRNSSFLNRMLTYLLYRCGAFAPDFSTITGAVARHNVPPANVICRYGANTVEHLLALFVDPSTVAVRFIDMKKKQDQVPRRLWAPGLFPQYSQN